MLRYITMPRVYVGVCYVDYACYACYVCCVDYVCPVCHVTNPWDTINASSMILSHILSESSPLPNVFLCWLAEWQAGE